MVDERGHGLPFTMRDVAACLKGVGNTERWARALNHCLERSLEREAALEITSQVTRLGSEVHKTFSGIVGAVDKFLSPLVNAYAPDIVFEDVLQDNGVAYVQLPANLFKLQGPAMGRVMLMDVQQEGSLRQVFRELRNQTPFAVTVDEFYNFADLSIVDSLNKLRDANLEFTLAHQSIADLELVSKEFAVAVWDNTRSLWSVRHYVAIGREVSGRIVIRRGWSHHNSFSVGCTASPDFPARRGAYETEEASGWAVERRDFAVRGRTAGARLQQDRSLCLPALLPMVR
jgi:hypothetical protein